MMRSHWTIGFALSATTVLLLAAGMFLPALLVFPLPIAYFFLVRKETVAWGLLLCAATLPALVAGSIVVGAVFGVAASYGILLGVLARKRITLGLTIAVLTITVFSVLASYSAANWDMVNAEWQAALQAQSEKFESAENGNTTESLEAIKNSFGWIAANLVYLYFGGLFSGILLVVAAVCALLYRIVPAEEILSTAHYRFRDMRTPEHLVWLAIVLAGLWFWDSRMPNEAVRFISWNSSFGLATVYWLNGTSIVFFLNHRWKWRTAWTFALLASMMLLNVISVLSIVGFFDTWIDFRQKASFARMAQPPDEKDDSDTKLD